MSIRWRGAISAEDKRRVEQAVRRGINRGIARSRSAGQQRGDAAVGLRGAPPLYDPVTSTITVPSFRDAGAPVQVPIIRQREAAPGIQDDELQGPYTLHDVARLIKASFPETGGRPGPGFYYGVYVSLVGVGQPYLYYLRVDETQHEVVEPIFLYLELKGQRGALRLEPGFYTVIFEPHGGGSLHDLTRRVRSRLGNPDNLDLRVSFVVSSQGGAPVALDKPRYRFYPRMHLLRLNEETPLATGSESVYAAVVDMWRVDEHWRPTQISFLAFIGTFPDFRWEIRRLTKPQDPQDEGELVRVEEGKDDYLRHTWAEEGDYRITCQVRVDRSDTSPTPVSDRLREHVILLEKKMATLLAYAESEEGKAGATRMWWTAPERLQALRAQLATEQKKAKEKQNSALIDVLNAEIAKIEEQLAPFVGAERQPFPIHAIFSDRKTSKTQPIHLFLKFRVRPELETSWVCYLIDLTYEPFYATYEGLGLTPHMAMLAAFEKSRKSLKENYPPGHIRARVSKADLEGQKLATIPGFHEWEFMTSTESFAKDAYQWLNIFVQVVGATALIASFVFPPSLLITGALVTTGLIGAGLSISNIIQRVEAHNFGWDVETFSDVANIAAAMVGLGAAAAEVRAGALARSLAQAREVTGESLTRLAGAAEGASTRALGGIASEAEQLTLSKLASLARLQRAIAFTGLGLDVANVLILGYGTYSELKMLNAYADQEREDYTRQFGEEDGRHRWEQERYTRILGILVRAGLQGTMLAISMKGAHERIADARARINDPGRLGAGAVEPMASTQERPTAKALRAEADWVESEVLELRAEAKKLEDRAARRPDRADRLQRRADHRRRVAALLEEDLVGLRNAANESEAAARATQLPGPEDLQRMLSQAEPETKLIKIELEESERRPELLPRLVRALLRSRTGNRVVYRVEGGTGAATSKTLTSVSATGDVAIQPGETIHLNFGSPDRAIEFLQQSRPGGRIVRFEVDEQWVQSLRSAAIPEGGTGEVKGLPRIVDVRFAEDQIQIPPNLIDELQRHIIPGSGQIAEPVE